MHERAMNIGLRLWKAYFRSSISLIDLVDKVNWRIIDTMLAAHVLRAS